MGNLILIFIKALFFVTILLVICGKMHNDYVLKQYANYSIFDFNSNSTKLIKQHTFNNAHKLSIVYTHYNLQYSEKTFQSRYHGNNRVTSYSEMSLGITLQSKVKDNPHTKIL